MTKDISIITPFYGEKDYPLESVVNTIHSVQLQTNQDFEWIIVIDGCREDWEFLEEAVALSMPDKLLNGDVSFIYTTKVVGPSVAKNIGVMSSTGKYITYMDMGDTLSEDRIDFLYALLKEFPQTLFLISCYDLDHPTAGRGFYNLQKIAASNTETRNMIESGVLVHGLGVLHSRVPFLAVGGFQPGVDSGEEMLLWRRMHKIIPTDRSFVADFNAGVKCYQPDYFKAYPNFSINYNDEKGSCGQYLDDAWYREFRTVKV